MNLEMLLNVVLLIGVGVCIALLVRTRRQATAIRRQRDHWSEHLRQLTLSLQQLVNESSRQTAWPERFARQLLGLLQADGVMVFAQTTVPGLGAGGGDLPAIRILGAAGQWTDLPGSEQTALLAQAAPNDFYWSRRPLVYGGAAVRQWLPADIVSGDFGSVLMAPLSISQQPDFFLFLYRRSGKTEYAHDEQTLLSEAVGQMEISLRAIFAIEDRKRLELALNHAHEEGMVQISTGIIHNIGNVITVIQLALERLREDELGSCGELAQFVGNDVMPTLKSHADAGDLDQFLQADSHGREYLAAIDALVGQLQKVLGQHQTDLQFIIDKFRNVTEIINLQQQFIGELGTENVVSIRSIVDDMVKICHAPMEQRGISLTTDALSSGRILVDPAMLRHILLMLIKYAIESVTASRKVQGHVGITALPEKDEAGREWIKVSIIDNGAGIHLNHEDLDRLHDEKPGDERVRDLLFCRRRIEKYGGRMTIHSDFARGLRITITLPQYVNASRTDSTPGLARTALFPSPIDGDEAAVSEVSTDVSATTGSPADESEGGVTANYAPGADSNSM